MGVSPSSVHRLRVLLCPCHYLFDEVTEGSEFAWAFNIGNGIGSRLPQSVVVTGAAQLVSPKPYRIVEVQPEKRFRDLRLLSAVRFNWRYFLATVRLTRHQNFNIIHHVLPFAVRTTFNLAWLLARPKGAKLVVGPIQQPIEVQDREIEGWDPKIIARPLMPMVAALSRRTVKRADRVVVIGEEAKRQVLALGIRPDKIHVISPGIDMKRFGYTSQSAKGEERFELLAIGHLSRRKGIDVTIRALAEIVQIRPNVRLTVLGQGGQANALQGLARELGIDDHIQFAGHIPNSSIGSYYERAHVLVSMSNSESFGAICLEAMASGVVVVATPVGVFSEAIQDGRNGCTVKNGDYLGLARTILSLMDDRPRLSAFASAARQRCEALYDWDRVIIPKYISLYEDLVNGEDS